MAGRGQHVQAALVRECWPNPLEDAGHGFDVVRQHRRAGREDLREPGGLAVEVGNQEFDAGLWVEFFDGAYRRGVQPGAAVGQVVAGDPGDGGIAQAHRLHALGDPPRLVAVQGGRLARVDLAEVTTAGALVAADQEGGFAVFPAFEDIGAARLLADGV